LNPWKGSVERTGGIATNIGIHFVDALVWLFGRPLGFEVHAADPQRQSGYLELERANVRWYLSIDRDDLPVVPEPGGNTTFRSITVDGFEIEFSEGFTDLHTEVYRDMIAGGGFGIEDARPSIQLAAAIRQAAPVGKTGRSHDFLARKRR
jgi:UDP-N-acetyl-2-amino-2-deoxyglucuronate dehydrogenase